MNTVIYDVNSNKPLIAGYMEDNNSTVITFTGIKKNQNTSELKLVIDGIGTYLLISNQLTITSEHTEKSGTYNACIVERTADDAYIRKSNTFKFVVKNSVLIGELVHHD